jgi:uncharacterized protein (TIRG00374 family)
MPENETRDKSTTLVGKPKQSGWQLALRIVVSIALLGYLFFVTIPAEDLMKILTLFLGSDLFYLFIALLCVLGDRVLSSWKWLLLLRIREPKTPLMPVLEIFFISTFLGYFMPSSIGGDALRAYSLSRLNRDLAGSASSVVIDRAYGIFGLLAISAVVLVPAVGSFVTITDAAVIWMATIAGLAGVVLISSRTVYRWFSRIAGLQRGGAIRSRVGRLVDASTEYAGRKIVLFRVFGYSMVVQVLRVVLGIFCGLALGLQVDPMVYFIAMPIVVVVTLLPISIAGFGVREAAFIYFFTRAGVPAYACLSLSLLYFAMGIVVLIPGAFIFALYGMGRKKTADRAAESD